MGGLFHVRISPTASSLLGVGGLLISSSLGVFGVCTPDGADCFGSESSRIFPGVIWSSSMSGRTPTSRRLCGGCLLFWYVGAGLATLDAGWMSKRLWKAEEDILACLVQYSRLRTTTFRSIGNSRCVVLNHGGAANASRFERILESKVVCSST